MASSQGAERIAASRRRAFIRNMARWPVVLLKAHVDGAPKADCPGLVVIGDGEGIVDGVPVEFVKVWLNGAASRLAVEKAGGRPLRLEFHGRDSTTKVGDSVRTFTRYATVEGVTLPTAYSVAFGGKELAGAASSLDAFHINPEAPAGLFDIPK